MVQAEAAVIAIFTANLLNINFGEVNIGKTKKDSITVTNTGTSNLIIMTIVSGDNVFTVDGTNGTIAPGSFMKFHIVFAPKSAVTSSSNITFTTNVGINVITVTGIGQISNSVENMPGHQAIFSVNYPNPFNISTTIQYTLINTDFVTLKIFDVNGIVLATLVNELQVAGTHSVSYSDISNSISASSGVYYYQLTVGSFVSTKQMILLK